MESGESLVVGLCLPSRLSPPVSSSVSFFFPVTLTVCLSRFPSYLHACEFVVVVVVVVVVVSWSVRPLGLSSALI